MPIFDDEYIRATILLLIRDILAIRPRGSHRAVFTSRSPNSGIEIEKKKERSFEGSVGAGTAP